MLAKPLSKTIQLGVIILALRLLVKAALPAPRIISRMAKALDVSRKAGYEAADRIERLLSEPAAPGGDDRREIAILRIRNQILTHERDHPEIRFAARGRHLPPEARSLCVRILRDFKQELAESQIASLLGVPLSSLRRWDSQADHECHFPRKPDRRGTHRRATAEDAGKVIAEFHKRKAAGRSMTLEEFTEHYRQANPARPLDRRTISRILLAEGLLEVRTRSAPKPYHDTFQIYFPGAQAAIDAVKCPVHFTGEPHETVTTTREVAIDIATCAILGDSLEVQENAEGVERVVVQARQECAPILAWLSDNRSANRAGHTHTLLASQSVVGQIFSFPYHPQTNGHIEGLFGQYARVVGTIEVDDSSRQATAQSISEVVFRIYAHFHNHSPRTRLGGLAPLEYLRRYANPPAEKVQEARVELQQRKQRADARRRPPARLDDSRFRSLVQAVLERNRLHKPLDAALKALRPYDNEAIQRAGEVFFSYAQRDDFDPSKRSFAYFMGIVRNKQKEIDRARRHAEAAALRQRRFREELETQQRQVERERAREEEDLKQQPENVILESAQLLLAGGLRFMLTTWLRKLRKALEALHELGRPRRVLEQLGATIRSWPKYPEQLKEQMVELLYAEHAALFS